MSKANNYKITEHMTNINRARLHKIHCQLTFQTIKARKNGLKMTFLRNQNKQEWNQRLENSTWMESSLRKHQNMELHHPWQVYPTNRNTEECGCCTQNHWKKLNQGWFLKYRIRDSRVNAEGRKILQKLSTWYFN